MLNDQLAAALVRAAQANGIETAALLAVVEVESAGQPLEADGATPRLLFERHVFHRELAARAPARLAVAVGQGLAHPDWRRDTQYKDQGSSAARLALLARARAVDVECTLRSCSWGLGQTMGFLAEEIGFANAVAMVDHMTRGGVDAQIDLMVREIRRKNIVAALNGHDWDAFALRYNGKGYKANRYDTKLAEAHARWRGRAGAIGTGPAGGSAGLSATIAYGERGDRVRELQQGLERLGYPVGGIDGEFGPNTLAAVTAFQRDRGLAPSGAADEATLLALRSAGPASPAGPTPPVVPAPPTAPAPLVLSDIDRWIGGPALAGKKTAIAVIAYVILSILQATNEIGTATGVPAPGTTAAAAPKTAPAATTPPAAAGASPAAGPSAAPASAAPAGGAPAVVGTKTPTGEILTTLILAFGGLGLIGKLDRIVKAVTLVASR
ncbi:N-acetylmuramidase domain-containing protein [Rhodoplanes sp. SY1]|uniref:N-acetylmuramidase domain-containing protein n=1 Tax=Rhodoplanes sp. SY1 TaxID=3166646 RepID=UPI0038B5261A